MDTTPYYDVPLFLGAMKGPPPTTGNSGFDTINKSGSAVPSLVPNTNLISNLGFNIDQTTPRSYSPTHVVYGSNPNTLSKEIGHNHDKLLRRPTTRSARASSSTSKISPTQISSISSSHHYQRRPTSMSKNKNRKNDHKKAKMDYHLGLPLDELIQNGLLYFLLMQQRKLPVKRADLIKNAMHGQYKDFKPLIEKLGLAFRDVFGINIVGLEGPGGKPGQHAYYILTSKYASNLVDSITYHTPESNFKRTILVLVLGTIYMMGRSLEEAAIWKLITALELHYEVGVKKIEELRRFLKSEFVMPMYLTLEESQGPDIDTSIVRYNWGCRAQKEFSKFSLLKFMAKQFRRKPTDFAIQFGVAVKEDKNAVDKYLAEVAAREERGEPDPDMLPPLVHDRYEDEDDGPHFSPPGPSTLASTTTSSGKKLSNSSFSTDSNSKGTFEDDNDMETESESEEVSEVEVEESTRQPRSVGKSMRIMREVYEEGEEDEDEDYEEGGEEEEEEEEEVAVNKNANLGSEGGYHAHFDDEDVILE